MRPVVQITGGKKAQREELQDIAPMLLKRLNLNKLGLFLEIELKNMGKFEFGFCVNTDCTNKLPRDFIVELNKTKNNNTLIRTLAHELVHVKQFARGEMFELPNGQIMWKGRKCHRTKYDDLPWEKDAFNLEVKLTEGILWNNK
jgi:hypothetical protein